MIGLRCLRPVRKKFFLTNQRYQQKKFFFSYFSFLFFWIPIFPIMQLTSETKGLICSQSPLPSEKKKFNCIKTIPFFFLYLGGNLRLKVLLGGRRRYILFDLKMERNCDWKTSFLLDTEKPEFHCVVSSSSCSLFYFFWSLLFHGINGVFNFFFLSWNL